MTDPKLRYLSLLTAPHATFLETVPFRVVAAFTALQAALLGGIWALVTFGGVSI